LCLHFLAASSSLLSSALFAVHPIHTEAVSGIVGRAELLSAVAFLSALLYYIHNRYRHKSNVWFDCGVTSLLAVLGLLCKEQALTVLAVCCIYEFFLPKNPSRVQSIRHLMLGRGIVSPWLRDKVLRIFLLAGAALVVLYLRWKGMGQRMPVFSRFDNPAAVASSPRRQLTYNYLLAVNAWLLLFPCHLCCDWTMSTIPLIEGIVDLRNLATIVLYGGFFYILKILNRLEEDVKMAVVMAKPVYPDLGEKMKVPENTRIVALSLLGMELWRFVWNFPCESCPVVKAINTELQASEENIFEVLSPVRAGKLVR
ncbi:Transmembrane and TPR repeat-containing protein 3, partial [Araneus ventricosus]